MGEFELEVLAKLGRRENSTNDTGDGYPEIFDMLERSKASLMMMIHEWKMEVSLERK